MEFFDKLGKQATKAYKITADKTGKIAKETKLRFKINDLRSKIDDIYEEIGKKVYEAHLIEDETINEELEGLCVKIDVLSDEIECLLNQCLELKDKKQCKNCFVEMDKEYKYCPNCGEKQFEQEEEETGCQEELKMDLSYERDEDGSKENDETSNLEKTVAVESNVENNDDEDEEENDNDDLDTY